MDYLRYYKQSVDFLKNLKKRRKYEGDPEVLLIEENENEVEEIQPFFEIHTPEKKKNTLLRQVIDKGVCSSPKKIPKFINRTPLHDRTDLHSGSETHYESFPEEEYLATKEDIAFSRGRFSPRKRENPLNITTDREQEEINQFYQSLYDISPYLLKTYELAQFDLKKAYRENKKKKKGLKLFCKPKLPYISDRSFNKTK